MIEATTVATSANSLLSKNQATGTVNYQENALLYREETFQLQTDTVNLTYKLESTTTYDRTLSIAGVETDGFELLRGLVLSIFKQQGMEPVLQTDGSSVDLETLTPEAAQELVATEGYFGVEKTSERIFSFAVGMAGDDISRLDAIKEGVEKGFQEALDAFGGWLPEISYHTYDAVMAKLDAWAGVETEAAQLT